jgi:hypothetical protein
VFYLVKPHGRNGKINLSNIILETGFPLVCNSRGLEDGVRKKKVQCGGRELNAIPANMPHISSSSNPHIA